MSGMKEFAEVGLVHFSQNLETKNKKNEKRKPLHS